MRTTFFVAAAFGALASAQLVKKDCNDTCMTFDQANVVANNFRETIANYSNALAEDVLASDFSDYSASVNELINSGCNGPTDLTGDTATFATLQSFEVGQGGQPPIPFEILNVWYACTGPVVLRWVSAQTPEQVTGNIVLETVRGTGDQPWLIETVYSEFNSGAWLGNLGIFTPQNCSSSNSTASKRSIANLPFNLQIGTVM